MNASNTFASPRFLRRVLWADALSCLGCGLLQLVFGASLAKLCGLPLALVTGTGIFLLVYAAIVALMAARMPLPHPLVWGLVIGNFMWAIDCVLLLVGPWASPTLPGQIYVGTQALTVTVLAELQWLSLRRLPLPMGAELA